VNTTSIIPEIIQTTDVKIFAVIPIEKNLKGHPRFNIKNSGTKNFAKLQKLISPCRMKEYISSRILACITHTTFIQPIKIESINPSSSQ